MRSNTAEIWQSCLDVIRDGVDASSFKTWFQPITPVDLEIVNGEIQLTVEVRNRFYLDWLETHYNQVYDRAVTQVLGPEGRLVFRVNLEDQKAPETNETRPAVQRPKARLSAPNAQPGVPQSVAALNKTYPKVGRSLPPVDSKLNKHYTFANFIEGHCNRLARSAALAVAKDPGTTWNPFLIYGGVGLGKTHLIQAIGNAVQERDAAKRVRFVSSEHFTNDFVQAIRNNEVSRFSSYYRSIDVLLIDDVQFFSGKEKTQEEFFHTFNELHQIGKQIILTADRPPKQIEGIEERLLSRFLMGMTADLQAPKFETRLAILNCKAEEEGIELSPNVMNFVARKVQSNVRELEGAMVRLMAVSMLQTEEVDLEMAKRELKPFFITQPTRLTVEAIQETVSDFLGIKQDLLNGRSRKREIVEARHIAMYLCRKFTGHSLKEIGRRFGKRDHTTVINAIKKVEDHAETNVQFREKFRRIQEVLSES